MARRSCLIVDMSNNYQPILPSFAVVAEAEYQHEETDDDRKMLTIDDCVAVASRMNELIDGFHRFRDEVTAEAGLGDDDLPMIDTYRRVRDFIKTVDIADGGHNTRKADRRLIAAYVCVIRGLNTEGGQS